MTQKTLTEFVSSFKTELARPSRFDVVISKFASFSERLSLRCENAEIPGRNFMTHDQKIYGPTEKYPYQNSYNDLTLTFIVGDDMLERRFFDEWMQFINPVETFNFNYKKDYTSQITINQYDVSGDLSANYTVVDAYPISVNQMDLDWSSDGHHKLVVVFAYTYWVYGDSPISSGGNVTVNVGP